MSLSSTKYKFDLNDINNKYIINLANDMLKYSHDPSKLKEIFSLNDMKTLLNEVEDRISKLPNIMECQVDVDNNTKVVIVGDIHGQFHDFMNIINTHGLPSSKLIYMFNGDFVDRGNWGVEILIIIFLLYILNPNLIYFCRGNHETTYCTQVYGFSEEVRIKYSEKMYHRICHVFAELPLACVILPKFQSDIDIAHEKDKYLMIKNKKLMTKGPGVGVILLHGGLFRKPNDSFEVGSLQDVLNANRSDLDPQGSLVEDILWSDPQPDNGSSTNFMRGCGINFGPDVTNEFLQTHGLSLFIRSHEGPDARKKRAYLNETMMNGYAIDHKHEDTNSPLLVTVFSAPDYPRGSEHCNNDAAIIILYFETHDKPNESLSVEDNEDVFIENSNDKSLQEDLEKHELEQDDNINSNDNNDDNNNNNNNNNDNNNKRSKKKKNEEEIEKDQLSDNDNHKEETGKQNYSNEEGKDKQDLKEQDGTQQDIGDNTEQEIAKCTGCKNVVYHKTAPKIYKTDNIEKNMSISLEIHIFQAVDTPEVEPYNQRDNGEVTDKE